MRGVEPAVIEVAALGGGTDDDHRAAPFGEGLPYTSIVPDAARGPLRGYHRRHGGRDGGGREHRARLRAVWISLAVSGLLLAAKYQAYRLTGSTAILSDALESIVNVVAAVFAIGALIFAGRPADRNHPYVTARWSSSARLRGRAHRLRGARHPL